MLDTWSGPGVKSAVRSVQFGVCANRRGVPTQLRFCHWCCVRPVHVPVYEIVHTVGRDVLTSPTMSNRLGGVAPVLVCSTTHRHVASIVMAGINVLEARSVVYHVVSKEVA